MNRGGNTDKHTHEKTPEYPFKNLYHKLLKKLKHAYEKCEFLKARNNLKATWKVIKHITHTNCLKNLPKELVGMDNGAEPSLNKLNEYFSSIDRD